MTVLVARNAMGEEVHSGDIVEDFRGDKSTFLHATRPATFGKSGKVVVIEEGTTYEYYDKVFGLTVTEEQKS